MGRFGQFLRSDPSDPRYQALARGLQDFGAVLGSGAGTEGFGALGPAVAYGTRSAGDTLTQERERERREAEKREEERRQAEIRRREDTRWEHTMEAWERAETDRERQQAEEEAGRVAEQERREAMLERIREAEGDQAAKRASLLSATNLEKTYAKVTGDPEPAGAPTTRSFPDGSLRQWDPSSSSWRVLQYEPAGDDEGSGLTPGQLRNEAQEVAKREVGTWPQWRKEYGRTREMQLPPRDESVAPGERVGRGTVLGEEVLDEKALRERYKREFDAAFERAMGEISGGKTSRAPAGGAPPAAPAAGAGQGRFEQLAGQVQQQLQERGAPPAAQERVQTVVEAVQSSVPPEIRDSEEFLSMLQKEIASGKDPQQIAREIREAFGGR